MLSFGAPGLFAQSTTTESPKTTAPSAAPHQPLRMRRTPPAATPPPSAAVAPPVSAKELQGLDVLASGGQQLGQVTKVNTCATARSKMSRSNRRDFSGCSRQPT